VIDMATKRRSAEPTPTGRRRPAADEPRPPWWRERKRGSARPPLTRDAIVDAAVRVLDAEGSDALTIRRLSQELDTGPATLYWHITGKEELAELVYDRIMGEIELPEPDPARWEEQLKEIARQGYRIMLSHNDAVKLSIGRAPVGPNMLDLIEWMLTLFEAVGLPIAVASYFGDLVGRYIDASVLEVANQPTFGETDGAGDGDGEGDEGAPVADFGMMIQQYFAGLPPDRYPRIVRMAGSLAKDNDDTRFEMGLDILVRGLRSYIDAHDDPEPLRPS
jgi:AcrR family transcriptional regulator